MCGQLGSIDLIVFEKAATVYKHFRSVLTRLGIFAHLTNVCQCINFTEIHSFWLWKIPGYSQCLVMSQLQDYLKTSSRRLQGPSSGRLQDILELQFWKPCSRCVQNVFELESCTRFEKTISGWPEIFLLELGLTLKTSRKSLQNVFISRDSSQRIWPNPQDVQKKSSKRFHFWGLFPDVLRTRSCAHWDVTSPALPNMRCTQFLV